MTAEATRAYRIDRVRQVWMTASTFSPPEDLDPVRLLEEHLATGWEFEADVVIEAPIEIVRRRVPPALGRMEERGHATTRLRGSTSNPDWYAEQLATIPWAFHIVRGEELRAAATAVAERLLAAARTEHTA